MDTDICLRPARYGGCERGRGRCREEDIESCVNLGVDDPSMRRQVVHRPALEVWRVGWADQRFETSVREARILRRLLLYPDDEALGRLRLTGQTNHVRAAFQVSPIDRDRPYLIGLH